MKKHGKAVRIEIEFEDGTVQRLVGEHAEKYMEIEASTSFNAWNHGFRIEPLPWEEIVKPKKEPTT